MTLPPPNICRQICALHALMGSPHDGEAQSARDMLIRMLAEHGLTWNDLAAILAAADAADSVDAVNDGATDGASPDEAASVPNLLDLVMRLIEEHVAVSSAERMAVALWALHTHVYDLYDVTPRLAFRSPTSECGKTTVLISLEHFVRNPYRADDVTAASIYTELHQNPHISLLLDEGDNLGLFENRVLRAVLNSGHRRGGRVARVIRGESRWLPTFVPVAIAAIGKLPLPLLRRSIVIEMTRRASDQPPLRRLDESDPAFAVAREEIVRWAASVQLARDPAIPPQLRNRAADNWRVLLAIADSLGYGEAARAVAIELSANHPNEDVVVPTPRGHSNDLLGAESRSPRQRDPRRRPQRLGKLAVAGMARPPWAPTAETVDAAGAGDPAASVRHKTPYGLANSTTARRQEHSRLSTSGFRGGVGGISAIGRHAITGE